MGKNEEEIMKLLPFVNIFEKHEFLDSIVQIYKIMLEENDMAKDIFPILNSFKGGAELLLYTPIASFILRFDGMGFLELIDKISKSS